MLAFCSTTTASSMPCLVSVAMAGCEGRERRRSLLPSYTERRIGGGTLRLAVAPLPQLSGSHARCRACNVRGNATACWERPTNRGVDVRDAQGTPQDLDAAGKSCPGSSRSVATWAQGTARSKPIMTAPGVPDHLFLAFCGCSQRRTGVECNLNLVPWLR